MSSKVRSVLDAASEAVETAAGYALVAVGIYAVLFLNFTGGGSLWDSMRQIRNASHEGLDSPNATRVIKVPTQAPAEKAHEDRILAVFDDPAPTGTVSAVYQAPDASGQRPEAALTDTPADPKAGKVWKRSLKGELRHFTVYGDGEQSTTATMSAGAPAPALPAAKAPAAVAAEGSPARAQTAAASRPGTSSRLSHGALSASDASRNVR